MSLVAQELRTSYYKWCIPSLDPKAACGTAYSDYATVTQIVSHLEYPVSQPSNHGLVRKSGRPLIQAQTQLSMQLKKNPSLVHAHHSAILKVRQSSIPPVSQSLSHLRAALQVHSSLSLGRYRPPTRSWCSLSTGHSEQSDRSSKQRDIHPSMC